MTTYVALPRAINAGVTIAKDDLVAMASKCGRAGTGAVGMPRFYGSKVQVNQVIWMTGLTAGKRRPIFAAIVAGSRRCAAGVSG